MGASYSFICCGLLGGALSHPDNESPLLGPLESRSYPEKLKILGGLGLVGFILFLLFYSSCHWSLDYCGFVGVTSGKNWVFAMLSGLLMGFAGVGLVYTFLRRSDEYGTNMYGSSSTGYNPAPTQPAISMI
jgi:hypothetical protein